MLINRLRSLIFHIAFTTEVQQRVYFAASDVMTLKRGSSWLVPHPNFGRNEVMPPILNNDSSILGPVFRPPRLAFRHLLLIVISLVLGMLVFWYLTATPIVDLGTGDNLINSELKERWMQGGVVVMVRHAERCDRSGNACLDDAEGITIKGRDAALAVGAGLRKLGLEKTRIITSPSIRTRQTANFMYGRSVMTEDWVSDCDTNFEDVVLANKRANENLILVTHSGCIDQFERKMGVRAGGRFSAYAETLFVRLDGKHKPRIIGSLNATKWKNI